MARTHLRETLSTLDPLQSWAWDILIPVIPGIADSREITYKAVSTQIPDSSVEQVGLEAHGVKLNFAGRRVWSGRWEATLFESRNAGTRDGLFRWLEYMRSWENNSGTYKSEYSVTAALQLYDDRPLVVREIQLYGLFPLEIGAVQLEQSSEIIRYNVTFSFDYTSG